MSLVIKTTGAEDYLDAGTANIKVLVMGAPGAGKTRSASYWPKPILADCEHGRMAVADRKLPYAEINSSADMDALLKMLALECRKPVAARTYQTFLVDTLDSYQRLVIQERLDAEKKESLSGWSDWGFLDAKMSQLVAKLQALSMNVVVNLHIKEREVSVGGNDDDDSTTKITVVGPKLKGDLREQIAAEFDLVGHMGTYWEAVDGERKMLRGMQWWPDPGHPILKDRSGQLPRWTPVTFSENDHGVLFGYLTAPLDALEPSQTLDTLETDVAVTTAPVAPQPGGPVAAPLTPPNSATARKTAAAPRKAAAPKTPTEVTTSVAGPVAAAPPAAAAAPPAATAVPTDVGVQPDAGAQVPAQAPAETAGADATPPAAAAPAEAPAAEQPAEAPEAHDEAVATAAASLGGEVISDPAATDTASTDVAAPAVESDAVVEVDGAVICGTGTPALLEREQPVQGCGKTINLDGPDAEPNPMLVEIAGLKTRTNLCNACFTAFRAAAS